LQIGGVSANTEQFIADTGETSGEEWVNYIEEKGITVARQDEIWTREKFVSLGFSADASTWYLAAYGCGCGSASMRIIGGDNYFIDYVTTRNDVTGIYSDLEPVLSRTEYGDIFLYTITQWDCRSSVTSKYGTYDWYNAGTSGIYTTYRCRVKNDDTVPATPVL
jgi:hypothetical protein